ncbi:uncharacterized protein LOC135399042 isoform X3 [Ornithodoros turicata]|uniref:uncharacterized protein LOC135399042 isoform X3 n=1 Tax=Ornithodoros turicata TaxID=34597 RepID=UPI0031391EFC
MWTAVVTVVIIAQCVSGALGQTCSLERAQQCRDDLQRQTRQETRAYRGQEVTTLCTSVRENMACLMWHSANCQTKDQQERSGDLVLAGKSFLDRVCDLDRGWRVSRCYQYDDIKKCEASFVGGGKGLVASDACRLFIAYRTCVKDVVSRRCSREDEQQLPSYLIDRARELSWQCGGTVSEARDIHSVYRASGPAAYAPYTQDSYCMVRASDALQECSRDHQRRQYNARKYYSDDRVREMCCATVEYRECIKLVLHDKCRDAGSSVVDSIIYQQTRELDYECRDFNAYRCAGCAVHVAKTTILLCLLAVFSKFYPRS